MRRRRVAWWRVTISSIAFLILCLVGLLNAGDGQLSRSTADTEIRPGDLLTAPIDCRVSGHTRDGSGNPMPDVTVYCAGSDLDSTISGADGYYVLHLRWKRDYWLFADKPGWQFTYVSVKSWELYDGARSTWDPIGTWKGFIIGGHVRDAKGDPVIGVGVTLSGDATGYDTTDVNGYYELRRFEPGSYTLTPAKARWGFWPAARNFELVDSHGGKMDFTGRPTVKHVEVKYGDPALVTIRILPPETGTVSLRIISLRGRVVWQVDMAVKSSQETTIDWRGRDASGREVASGVYIASIRGAGCNASRKIVIVR
jgi:hypothetical protein